MSSARLEPAPQPSLRFAVAIDTGGTFTDVTLFDRTSGSMWTAKTPSTPDDPSRGFINGVGAALEQAGLQPSELGQVFHGTTVATNLILEGKGAKVGLLTTAGFKHVLEIGRQDIPRRANMFSWVKPKRPVPPGRIFEIPERLEVSGNVLEPLDEDAVRDAARGLMSKDVSAIAVCFLHSFTNPVHEQRAAQIIREMYPHLLVSISSDVLRVFREYERSMACVLNVYVMPAVSQYVGQLRERLDANGVEAPLLIMKSNGGVVGAEEAQRVPAHTVLSGPAAGVVGARFVGESAGVHDIIGIDIGGTSADICLIQNGDYSVTSNGRIGEWPLPLPMLDITTVGTGGGSIARVSDSGALTVGPVSAGASPGPACYGRGGEEPTVTDAHLVLGHLPPYLLGGTMSLDIGAAREAVGARVAKPLGLAVEDAARGILAISNNDMVGAIRVISVERGLDPRDFALVPFGGAGPLHGSAIAELLGMKTVIVPTVPGVLSALGLLVSQLRADYSQTCFQTPPDFDYDELRRAFASLEGQALAWFERERVPPVNRELSWRASVRYRHQGFELTVPWEGRRVTPDSTRATLSAFHALHEQLYTFAQHDTPVEIVTLHVSAVGTLSAPALPELPSGGALADAVVDRLPVTLPDRTCEVPVYAREKLSAEMILRGPALVVQIDSTILVNEHQTARCDRYGNLFLESA